MTRHNLFTHVLIWLFAGGLPLRGVAQDAERPGQFAVLIGVDGYEHAPQLEYSAETMEQLSQTLRRYAGYRSANVLPLLDSAYDTRRHPTRRNVQQQVPAWLSKAGADDRLVLVFNGHAWQDEQERLYLLPLDGDPDDLAGTAIRLSWLAEQLAACAAANKLVILDTRQSKPEQTASAVGVAAADLLEPLRSVPGVTALAASATGQASLIWEERQRSLFSYWLIEAIKGHADLDGDRSLTGGELFDYLTRQMTATAERHFSARQQPRQVRHDQACDTTAWFRLRAQSLKRTLGDMAEQLAVQLQLAGHERVGVLEFLEETGTGESLGAEFGLLGRSCAADLESYLVAQSVGRFGVADRQRMAQAVKQGNFTVDQFGSNEALADLGRRAGEVPVVVVGTFLAREGRVVRLRCQLLATDGTGLVGQARGVARLNDSEWALLGRSVRVEPTDYPKQPELPAPTIPLEVEDIGQLEERADRGHPLADPSFPYRVSLVVDGQRREPVFRGAEALVPVAAGERYQVRIENHSQEPVFLRLLVDGLNTLPERVLTGKGVRVEVLPRAERLAAQPVNLSEARAWRLDAPLSGRTSRAYIVRGFYSQVGDDSRYNVFQVVDARDSQAARLGFAEQAGLITAAFYEPVPKSVGQRSVGTALGPEYRSQTELYRGETMPGPLRDVVHLRYVAADALE